MTEAQKLIIQAAEILGGLRVLARCLDVSERAARGWASGERNPSPGVWADLGQALEAHGRKAASLASVCRDFQAP